ncbi:MAG: hypothetical protein WBM13_01780 [Bacteroidia bacterium]
MIAYNQEFINNLAIVKKAKQWYARNLISDLQMITIQKKYTANFYNPNLFVKIGLFVFTCVAISAALGFYTLFCFTVSNGLEHSDLFPVFTCMLFAALCFVGLELFVRNKLVYRSGVDEALLYSALGFILSGILYSIDYYYYNTTLVSALVFLPFVVIASIRYTDTIVTIVTVICLYIILFYLFLKLGAIAKLIMPFFLMLVSASLYFVVKKLKQKEALLAWKKCLIAIECITMIVFYLACNYFVIRETSISFFNMDLNEGEDIPLAFVFYLLTALVPMAYVFMGLKNKDKISLWIGLLLVAVAAFTFKYYFSLGHPEISLTIAGVVMILIAYTSIRYLKTDKHGVTFKEDIDEDNFLKTNAEALLIAQSFSKQVYSSPQPDNNLGGADLGGGDFGGAGSGGNY